MTKADIQAGDAIRVVQDIYATSVKAGAEVLAGGVLYVPGGSVNAGGRISAQLLHAKSFYPGIPIDLAMMVADKDRSVIGNVTGGAVMNGIQRPHPRPTLVPRYRVPAEVAAVLDKRTPGMAVEEEKSLELSL